MATGMYRMPIKTYTAISKATEEIIMCYIERINYLLNTTKDFQKLGFPAETWELRE